MAEIIQWTPSEMEDLHSHIGATFPTRTSALVNDPDLNGPSFGEAFAAGFQRENVMMNVAEAIGRRINAGDEMEELDPSFNPYSFMRQNWSEEDRQRLDHEIRSGLFEDIRSPAQLAIRKATIQREKDLLEKIEGGSFVGGTLGMMAGATLDVTTLTPLGFLKYLRTGSRVIRGAAAALTTAGVSELGLQATQELRTAQETFLNIGVSGFIGGGIGAFSRAINPGHPLHTRHPENPLKVENIDKQGIGVRTPDGHVEIIEGGSVGAAAAPIDAPRALPGLTSNIPGINKLTEKITGITPVGRALRYTGERSRELLVRMMDLGGVLTDTNRFGVRTAHSAEDLKWDLLVKRDRLFLFGEKQLTELNRELGQSDVAQKFGLRGQVHESAFSEVARKKLLNEWGDADTAALVREYGEEAAPKIEARAEAFAERIHETNAEFERELIELGKLSPDQAMGRDYGHAQLWDPHSVMARQEDFEDFLLDVFKERPDHEWLSQGYQLTEDEFVALRESDPQRYATILRDWAGDEHHYNVSKAETKAEAAARALKQAELDLTDIMRAYRFVGSETRRLELSQARKFRDRFHAQLEAERVKKTEAETFRKAFAEASSASRAQTQDRLLNSEVVSAKAIREAEEAVEAAEKRLFVTVSDSLKDPASRGRVQFSGEYARRVAALADADARLNALVAKSPDPAQSARTARAAARAQKYAADLQKADAAVRRMEQRLARVEEAFQRVAEKLETHKKAKAAISDALSDARKAKGTSAKDLKKARRALTKAEKRAPLAEMVSDIHLSLINRQELPHSILDRIIPETGRVKARRIRLTPDQRRVAEEKGFLRTDLSTILNAQYDQLSGFIGLHKALDIREGGRFASWQDVTRVVDDEYRGMIARAGSEKDVSHLNSEWGKVKTDLNLLKDRLLGTENVGADKDGWAYWMSQKARQANFIRWGAGFLLPSLTDVASVHFRTGSIARLLRTRGKEVARIMQSMDDTELRAMVNATELGAQGVRMARAMDADDALHIAGIGPRGTFKHDFTSRVDRGAAWLSDKTNIVSGMRAWNRFWKIAAGIERAYKLRDMVGRYDALSERELTELASLGIDREGAKRIRGMIRQHGSTDAQGHWDPNLEAWSATPEGREAARDFRVAVVRDMNRAIFTPGIGDTPGIMSHALGRMWLQFQTYAFAFMNRFMVPASQRIATWKDAQAVAAYGHLLWTGLVVVLGKDILHGRDPMERFEEGKWGDTTKELIDRSGLLTFMSPYVDSLLKVSAPAQEALFGEVQVGPTSRFVRNRWMESAFGASYGLFRDIEAFGSALAEADKEKITKKGLLLLPFNTYLRLMHQMAEE